MSCLSMALIENKFTGLWCCGAVVVGLWCCGAVGLWGCPAEEGCCPVRAGGLGHRHTAMHTYRPSDARTESPKKHPHNDAPPLAPVGDEVPLKKTA